MKRRNIGHYAICMFTEVLCDTGSNSVALTHLICILGGSEGDY